MTPRNPDPTLDERARQLAATGESAKKETEQ